MKNQPQHIGNYLIEQEIGRGATSEVWLARHAHLPQRLVAIKFLLAHDDETVERFKREASIVSQLHHPNIVQIFDHGYQQPFYYTILEYVHGSSLQALLARMHRLDLPAALAIFRQIAAALDYAHQHNIIHRDVAPGNVLVAEETGRALLTDFGIARNPAQTMTMDYRIMGTPGYWSPEHLRSATDVTPRSDIYGLGVLLYVMLCGELPWDTLPGPPDTPFAPPVPLKQRGIANLPGDVERVITTMLAIDPSRRFPTAGAALDELERILQRHHATTQIYDKTPDGNPTTSSTTRVATPPGNGDIETSGVEDNAVERALGADLVRAPISEAHERAALLCQPESIARLLDAWSQHGFARGFFRLNHPGRLARLHRVRSRNRYTYTLRILYEQRGEPQALEEPDRDAQVFPLEPEIDRWQMSLVSVQGFHDDAGDRVIMPGSAQVITCRECSGKGKLTCTRCKGRQRIQITQQVPVASPDHETSPSHPKNVGKRSGSTRAPTSTAAVATVAPAQPAPPHTTTRHVLVPCPACEGRGGTPCTHCESTGRIVQRKAFRWQRVARTISHADPLPDVSERWFEQTCTPVEIYREQMVGTPPYTRAPFRDEWDEIPELKALLDQSRSITAADTRIIMSELVITMVPITSFTFDIGRPDTHGGLYESSICGFENALPPDWRLLNWERVVFFWGSILLLLTAIALAFAFAPPA